MVPTNLQRATTFGIVAVDGALLYSEREWLTSQFGVKM